MSLDKIFESFTAAKRILQDSEFLSRRGLKLGKRISGAHDGFRGVEIVLGFCGVLVVNCR